MPKDSRTRLSKEEAYVLYQVEEETGKPDEIADILEGLDKEDVEKVLSSLKKKKLVELAEEGARITEKGKKTMDKNKKLLFK